MDIGHIHRTSDRWVKELKECSHCRSKIMVLIVDGKPAQDQKCTRCWKPFG